MILAVMNMWIELKRAIGNLPKLSKLENDEIR